MRQWLTILLFCMPLGLMAQWSADSLAVSEDTVEVVVAMDSVELSVPQDTIAVDSVELPIAVDSVELSVVEPLEPDTIPQQLELPAPTPVDPRLELIAHLDSQIRVQDERIMSYSYLPRFQERYTIELWQYLSAPAVESLDEYIESQQAWLRMQDSCMVYLSHRASLYVAEEILMPLLDSIGWAAAYREYAQSGPFVWSRGASLRQLAPLRTLLDRIEPVARQQQLWMQGEQEIARAASFNPQLLNSYTNYVTQNAVRPHFYSPATLDSIAMHQQVLRASQEHCRAYLERMQQVLHADTLLSNMLVGKPFYSSYIGFCQPVIMAPWQPALNLQRLDSVIYVQQQMPEVLSRYQTVDSLNQQILKQGTSLPDVLRSYQTYRMQVTERPTFKSTDDIDAFLAYLELTQRHQRHCLSYIEACHAWQKESSMVVDSLTRCGLLPSYQTYARTISLSWSPDCTTAHLEASRAILALYLQSAARLTRIQQRADSICSVCDKCRDVELSYRQLYQSYESEPTLFTRTDFSALDRQYAQMERDQLSCIRFIGLRDTLHAHHQTMRVQLEGQLLMAYQNYYGEQDTHWYPLGNDQVVRAIMQVQDSLLAVSSFDKLVQTRGLECLEASARFPSIQQAYRDYQMSALPTLQIHDVSDVTRYNEQLHRVLYDQRVFMGFVGTRSRVAEGHQRVLDRTLHLQNTAWAYRQYYQQTDLEWHGPSDWGARMDSVCMVQAAFVRAAVMSDSIFAGVDELLSLADELHASDVKKLYPPHFREYQFSPSVANYADIERYNAYLRGILDEQADAAAFVQMRQELLDMQEELDAQMRPYMRMRTACKALFKSWDTSFSFGSDCLRRLQQYQRIQQQIGFILRSPDAKTLAAEFKSGKDVRLVQLRIEQLASQL